MAKTAVVLIVEGNQDMRSLLCDAFTDTGYHLCEVQDVEEAFLTIRQSVPDLILTDL